LLSGNQTSSSLDTDQKGGNDWKRGGARNLSENDQSRGIMDNTLQWRRRERWKKGQWASAKQIFIAQRIDC